MVMVTSCAAGRGATDAAAAAAEEESLTRDLDNLKIRPDESDQVGTTIAVSLSDLTCNLFNSLQNASESLRMAIQMSVNFCRLLHFSQRTPHAGGGGFNE